MGSPPEPNTSRSPAPASGLPMVMSTNHLSAQHERLILELLPFKDAGRFHEWLRSDFVRGSWVELCRDYLSSRPPPGEPDKAKTAQAAKDAISSRSQKFLLYHPDKTNWTADDHHVRFIVTVIQDNILCGLWSESDWKKRSIDISRSVYEVLSFLKSNFYMADQNPPGYTQ